MVGCTRRADGAIPLKEVRIGLGEGMQSGSSREGKRKKKEKEKEKKKKTPQFSQLSPKGLGEAYLGGVSMACCAADITKTNQ